MRLEQTVIGHHQQAGLGGSGFGGGVGHALLEPEHARADADRGLGHAGYVLGAAEHIHDINWPQLRGNGVEVGVGAFAQHLGLQRVDRDDAIPLLPQVPRHAKAGPGRIVGEPDHGDGAGAAQQGLDRGGELHSRSRLRADGDRGLAARGRGRAAVAGAGCARRRIGPGRVWAVACCSCLTSTSVSGRNWPERSAPMVSLPIATRFSFSTGWPTDWNILRIWWFRPSISTTSNHGFSLEVRYTPARSRSLPEAALAANQRICAGAVLRPSM